MNYKINRNRLNRTRLAACALWQAQNRRLPSAQGRRLALSTMMAIALCAGLSHTARAQGPNFTGTYQEAYALVDVNLQILHQGDELSGQAVLTLFGFEVGNYLFKGEVRPDGIIVARNGQGGVFVGRLSPDQSKVSGTVVNNPDERYEFTINRPQDGWGSAPR